jgi:hypothetical protein
MGVPVSEVGYTLATAWRGDHEVHKGHVEALGEKIVAHYCCVSYCSFSAPPAVRILHQIILIFRFLFRIALWRPAFRRVRKFAKNDKLLHVCPSVRKCGTTRLPLKVFLWNLIFEYFSKNCRELQVSLTLSLLYIHMELLVKPEILTSSHIHVYIYIYGLTFGNVESRLFLLVARCFNTE